MYFVETKELETASAAVKANPTKESGLLSTHHLDYTHERRDHTDLIARRHADTPFWSRYYHRKLRKIYRFLVNPGQRVLEVGSGTGNLLAALKPSVGVGIDFSPDMIRLSRSRHPQLRFIEADAHSLKLDEKFDVVILSDLVNDLWDVQRVLESVRDCMTPRTRIVLNWYNRVWQGPLSFARRMGLARPVLTQNWLSVQDLSNLLNLADCEVLRTWNEMLCPVRIPVVSTIANRVLARVWPFNHLSLSQFIVARPKQPIPTEAPRVSVIVPARNESGNIANVFSRVPRMGKETELVFVEGHSTDDTYDTIQREIAGHPEWPCVSIRQLGRGKGDAVRHGFAAATGDVLMILDADLTVPPEELQKFYDALVSGKGEFINGVRLVYPMRAGAMRIINHFGNKFFSLAFSWLLGQPIKDTLCGTKVLWKKDYEAIAAHRSYFGDIDPFGDFDLIFGAAKLNMKIVDLPVRYGDRVYGTTNINRWKHGWLLLRMTAKAARQIKFF